MSHIPKKMPRVAEGLARIYTRTEIANTASPFIAFSAIGFILLLAIFSAIEINPRIQSIGKPVELSGPEAGDARLWLGVATNHDKVIVKGNDGRTFVWSLDGPNTEERTQFEAYLQSRVHDIIIDATLAGRLDESTVRAVISVDERLNFHHVRPLLYALGSARITHYAFEGRIVN